MNDGIAQRLRAAGETDPTEARKDKLVSTASISRCKLARMARRALSITVPTSATRRSRISLRTSRMPLAKMRSIGPQFWLRCCAVL